MLVSTALPCHFSHVGPPIHSATLTSGSSLSVAEKRTFQGLSVRTIDKQGRRLWPSNIGFVDTSSTSFGE